MTKRSRTQQKKPVPTLHGLLSEWQWRWLEKELLLWKFMPGEFGRLRAAPYPLDPPTAALVAYLGAEYALPWPVVRVEFERWVYPGFLEHAAQVEADFTGRDRADVREQFPSPDLVAELGLWPAVDGLPGDWPMHFVEECEQHQQALRVAIEGTELLRKCVRVPYLPLGGTMLSFLPLVENEWIDAEAIALCEASGGLTRAGYVRLQSDDSHLLAWHRFFPQGTWWHYPKPCPREVFLEAVGQARLALKACPARKQELAGRLHVHYEDYAAWECRSVPGDLSAGLFDGIWVRGWNAWAEDPAVRRDGLAGLPVGVVPRPCRFEHGKDFTLFESVAESEAALACRRQEFSLKTAAALAEAGKTPGYWPFSDVQKKVLAALEGKAMLNVDLAPSLETPAELEAGDGSRQRTLYRELPLLTDMGLVANDPARGGYYRPDRPPAGHTATRRGTSSTLSPGGPQS